MGTGCIGGQTGTPQHSSACEGSEAERAAAQRELEAFAGRYVGPAGWEGAASSARQSPTTLRVELVLRPATLCVTAGTIRARAQLYLRTDDGALDVSVPAAISATGESVSVSWRVLAGELTDEELSGQLQLSASGPAALEANVGEATLRASELSKEEE